MYHITHFANIDCAFYCVHLIYMLMIFIDKYNSIKYNKKKNRVLSSDENIIVCVCVCVCVCIVTQSCPTLLQPHGLQLSRLLCPCSFSGKNNGVGSHSHLQGILLTQGSNPSLLHCRQILYHLSHQGSHLNLS